MFTPEMISADEFTKKIIPKMKKAASKQRVLQIWAHWWTFPLWIIWYLDLNEIHLYQLIMTQGAVQ